MQPRRLTLLLATPLALALAGIGHSPAIAAAAPNPAVTDKAEVRGLLTKVGTAWERGDAKEFASFYTPNGDLVDFAGNHARGRNEIVKLLQPLFDGVLKNTRVEARIVDLRFLSEKVAIFHTRGQIVPTGGDSIQTFVATKGARGWLIASFQNTRVQKNP